MRNQKGFTLIEIIAVLVILGILAAVAIPRYFGLQEQAADKVAQAALAEGYAALSIGWAANKMGANGAPNSPDAALGAISKSGDTLTNIYASPSVTSWGNSGAAVNVAVSYKGGTKNVISGFWNVP